MSDLDRATKRTTTGRGEVAGRWYDADPRLRARLQARLPQPVLRLPGRHSVPLLAGHHESDDALPGPAPHPLRAHCKLTLSLSIPI